MMSGIGAEADLCAGRGLAGGMQAVHSPNGLCVRGWWGPTKKACGNDTRRDAGVNLNAGFVDLSLFLIYYGTTVMFPGRGRPLLGRETSFVSQKMTFK